MYKILKMTDNVENIEFIDRRKERLNQVLEKLRKQREELPENFVDHYRIKAIEAEVEFALKTLEDTERIFREQFEVVDQTIHLHETKAKEIIGKHKKLDEIFTQIFKGGNK